MAKQKITCRVCGKFFEPCAYCKSHADVFRWRNFACSRECATKYIEETTSYRESLRTSREEKLNHLNNQKETSDDIIVENTKNTEENETV